MPDTVDPRENRVRFGPGHAMSLDHRGDETAWLWCECDPDQPVHVWGDPDAVVQFYSGPSPAEIQAVVDAHNAAHNAAI